MYTFTVVWKFDYKFVRYAGKVLSSPFCKIRNSEGSELPKATVVGPELFIWFSGCFHYPQPLERKC